MNNKQTNKGVFDPLLIDKLKAENPTYSIGIDTYDEERTAYVLCKYSNGKQEILLAKTGMRKKQMEEEVANLSKYFNAPVYRED